jgi:antitoxin component YwqK of YwqJK toxin-antitoxin module
MDSLVIDMEKLNVDINAYEELLNQVKVSTISYHSGYSQIVRTNRYKNLHGNQEVYDEKRQIVRFEQYTDGYKNGYFRKYHQNVMVSEYHYVNGMLDGVCREWNFEGEMLSYIEYKNNMKNGKSVIYIKPLNQVRYTEYKNNIRHGNDIAVEGNVNVLEMTYYEGIPYGKLIKRHLNGQLLSEIKYVNGLMEGDVIEYGEKGDILSIMKVSAGRFIASVD